MLTLNERQIAAAKKQEELANSQRIEQMNNLPITENMIKYLLTKKFSLSFLATLNRKQFFNRTACINEAKSKLVGLATSLNALYDTSLDAILYDNTPYFFGKVPEEFMPGLTVSALKERFNNEAFDEALQKYLSQYWVSKDTFAKAVANGYAVVVPEGMTTNMAIESARFNLTVEQYNEEKAKLNSDRSFLNQYIASAQYRDLVTEGLVEAEEDTSRSADAEERKKFFEALDEDSLTLYLLSRKVDQMLRNVNPFFVSEDADVIYSLDEISELVSSMVDVTYESTFNGVTTIKKMGAFNRILRFWEFYENKRIDLNVLKKIAVVNDWILNKFIEAKA